MAASWTVLGRGSARRVLGAALWESRGCARKSPCDVALTGAGLRSAGTHSGEKVTHTGQVFDDGDYRKVRFVGKHKEVNEQFAINLIAEQPVNESGSRIVWCDGGGGALGHPKVYINLDKETKTGTCGYCGLQFKQKHHH
ncbi:Accessory subunit of the mitochondrial membrane respiratory chain NADH dehydrogenase (Complex I) [Pristimantis euphronides]